MSVDKKENHDVRELNHGRRVLDFLKYGFIAFVISMLLVVASIVVIFVKGFNLGQDFTGGTTIELTVTKSVNLDDLRNSLRQAGYHEPVVQYYGSSKDIIIRLATAKQEDGASAAIDNALGSQISNLIHKSIDENAQIKRIEFVGPTVGAELAQDGILAICAALVCILIYIAFRFEWRFGTGAVVALAHDVIITAGYLSLFERELDLTIIAAMLSIIGYSLNDTIVVFDRIRENFRKIRRASPYDVINISLTQTLHRTLMTSGTTLAVVIILYIFGGSMLKGFSETLGVGIVLGTISSIYVAAYMSLKLGVKREHFMPPKVEVEGADQPAILR
ncbi:MULTISPECIES: protein translocase subunit SecF [unclassified Gilliamella]|uniref:protein translocase subunit SecF n=1 Tax=unclassified Gilliamella TaxID=2685620 RepID=UPI001C6966A0|nr:MULTISPECIES: protein translocase subunit SecF [unclassified Gilliamella]MCX8600283.1 protein translocase subunit SecF [Gilliamella sp. B3722]MCX8609281.1 protein translocase subunit SecF [Gilliamella sp. B3771]MCX8609500.1 protein translocase subunit SecF [Gilliamella sp. B3891]MCX8612413.1 protein translocase subunit SecF [Gilliamella sp. B3773]MCX8615831.1 protein translocase subunit SecF [Gilliamella sp. B3770]